MMSSDLENLVEEDAETAVPIATVVSLCPFEIKETKPGINPGTFKIAAAKKGDFQILVIGISKYGVYLDGDRGTLSVPELGERIAKSVVFDFVNSQYGIDDDARPGLFYVLGRKTRDEIVTEHVAELEEYRDKQERWFRRLIMAADDHWARFQRHNSITDLQRLAAKFMGHKAPWVI